MADAGRGSDDQTSEPRLPRSVQAVYLRPLKRQAQYGVPACDLQLRSYNARNLEFFADFALRAAYYLHLPASGPKWAHFGRKKNLDTSEKVMDMLGSDIFQSSGRPSGTVAASTA